MVISFQFPVSAMPDGRKATYGRIGCADLAETKSSTCKISCGANAINFPTVTETTTVKISCISTPVLQQNAIACELSGFYLGRPLSATVWVLTDADQIISSRTYRPAKFGVTDIAKVGRPTWGCSINKPLVGYRDGAVRDVLRLHQLNDRFTCLLTTVAVGYFVRFLELLNHQLELL